MSTTPYSFIKRGNLFIIPVGPSIDEVPYPTQAITKPRDYSLWVRGKLDEPPFQLDQMAMPPGMYQDVRDDLLKFSPVPVTRSAFRRSQHAYIGVIDSRGTPYYFALDSRGISIREAPPDDDRVWKTFDTLVDSERSAALGKRRVAAAKEMDMVARELSEPLLMIAKSARPSDRSHPHVMAVKQMLRELNHHTPPAQLRLPKPQRQKQPKQPKVPKEKQAKAPKTPKEKKPPKTSTTYATHGKYRVVQGVDGVQAYYKPNEGKTKRIGVYSTHAEAHEAVSAHHHAVKNNPPAAKEKKPQASNEHLDAWKRKYPGGQVEGVHIHAFQKSLSPMLVILTTPRDDSLSKSVLEAFRKIGTTHKDASPRQHEKAAKVHLKAYEKTGDRQHKDMADAHRFAAHVKRGGGGAVIQPSTSTGAIFNTPVAGGRGNAKMVRFTKAQKKRRRERTGPDAWRFKKALPKKSKEEPVKKQRTGKATKKQAGAGGKTRYTYPQEKKKKNSANGRPVPLVVGSQQPPSDPHSPHELANQLGVSVRTLQRVAKKLGRAGFSRYMQSHLKRFSVKHRLDADYWGTLYARLRPDHTEAPLMGSS